MLSGKQGYSITTRRLRLRCKHPEWLHRTQDFYNDIALFYYRLLLDQSQLWTLNSQKTLRELELLSLPGRDKREPEVPLPWEKVPLYFRRAAANAGIAAAKSYIARAVKNPGRRADRLNAAVAYYKGMYRNFTSSEITLKVWDGEQWQWLRCRLYGQEFPLKAQLMSPAVVFDGKFIMLHVPVKETVYDTFTVRQSVENGRKLCAVQFTNGDAFAVASICDAQGKETAVRFFKGGSEYGHHCRIVMDKIEKSRASLGDGICQAENPNKKHWMHLKHLGEHYAHDVSSGIVQFCKENHAAILVLPKYDKEYTRSVMYGSGDWSPIHLSTRIRQFLPYKAWKNAIPVIEVNAKGISSVCAKCNAKVTDMNRATEEYFCADGHRGNRHLNAARNLGRKCLIQFGKHVD